MITETITWSVLEAFAKFGFGDGDGDVRTHIVTRALFPEINYETDLGIHNPFITVLWIPWSVTLHTPAPDTTQILTNPQSGIDWAVFFDGYNVPTWEALPELLKWKLLLLDPLLHWDDEARDNGLEVLND